MGKQRWQIASLMALSSVMTAQAGYALPGVSLSAVEDWIRNNPTLRPQPYERLLVQRSDTPSRRFSFQASPFPVTGVDPTRTGYIIRTEQLSLFDQIDGVSANRLEESLRAVYGLDVYRDYRQAEVLYRYPTRLSEPRENPNLLLQGEVRRGERYAYWVELALDPQGNGYSGQMTVFLKEDLPALLTQLRNAPGGA